MFFNTVFALYSIIFGNSDGVVEDIQKSDKKTKL